MTIAALILTIIGLSVWLGAVVFKTFIVSPTLARKLTPSKLAEVLDVLFPRYYWLGVGGGITMLAGGTGALNDASIRTPTITYMVLTGLALVLFLYARLVILPRMVSLRARLQSSAGIHQESIHVRDRFDQANFVAVFLNFLVMGLLVGAAVALGFLLSPGPVTSG